jgi:hypothetical protein
MASATLVHFGFDQCFRVRVLESAGFQVADCDSLDALSLQLMQEPKALLLEDEPVPQIDCAISLSKSYPELPVVYFRCLPDIPVTRSKDLVIPSFTPPELWLREIRQLVARSQAVLAESRRLRAQSAALARDCAAVHEDSRRTIQSARLQLARHRKTGR